MLDLLDYKDKFNHLLLSTKRKGVKVLLEYIELQTDFYNAPASTKYHGNFEGGLLQHSLAVCNNLFSLKSAFFASLFKEHKITDDQLYIASLLHDICKTNVYKRFKRNFKNPTTGQWEERDEWTFDDQYPAGHGEKSVIILQKYITLTDNEIMAIRWHMGAYDDSARQFAGGQALSKAMEQYPLVLALHLADQITSFIDKI